jgi:predicted dehydrogenase
MREDSQMSKHKEGKSLQNGGLTRRQFVKQAATASAVFSIVPRHVLGGAGHIAPSEKINIAGIGIGGRGSDDLRGVETENIVALCDVDWDYAAKTFGRYPSARRYRDYREMLASNTDIDAVVIATPDHTHAIISMAAMTLGKHVYCEKPLTRTVGEARALTLAARKAKVATQMGNQGMAFEGNRLIKEWLQDDAIGPVREVHCWSDRPTHQGKNPLWWAQGIERPTDTPPVPESLDWDLWLGPAPERPYHPAYVPFAWRGWWDFGSGGLGDMGIHNLAPAFSALKLGAPTSVHASSTPVFKETLPVASTVHYEFPARGDLPPVTLHWYDGGLLPPRPKALEDAMALPREDGLIFVGDKGTMMVSGWGGHSPCLVPLSRMQNYKRPAKTLARSIGHHTEWIKACKEGTPTESNFGFAGPMTEAVLLGTVCVRLGGRKLDWDSRAMKVTNLPQANEYLNTKYRNGWSL